MNQQQQNNHTNNNTNNNNNKNQNTNQNTAHTNVSTQETINVVQNVNNVADKSYRSVISAPSCDALEQRDSKESAGVSNQISMAADLPIVKKNKSSTRIQLIAMINSKLSRLSQQDLEKQLALVIQCDTVDHFESLRSQFESCEHLWDAVDILCRFTGLLWPSVSSKVARSGLVTISIRMGCAKSRCEHIDKNKAQANVEAAFHSVLLGCFGSCSGSVNKLMHMLKGNVDMFDDLSAFVDPPVITPKDNYAESFEEARAITMKQCLELGNPADWFVVLSRQRVCHADRCALLVFDHKSTVKVMTVDSVLSEYIKANQAIDPTDPNGTKNRYAAQNNDSKKKKHQPHSQAICYECKQRGHIAKNCPNTRNADEEIDWDKEYLLNSAIKSKSIKNAVYSALKSIDKGVVIKSDYLQKSHLSWPVNSEIVKILEDKFKCESEVNFAALIVCMDCLAQGRIECAKDVFMNNLSVQELIGLLGSSHSKGDGVDMFANIHGNYCGVGTSDYTLDPVDELDAQCLEHDLAYGKAVSAEDFENADLNLASHAGAAHPLITSAMLANVGLRKVSGYGWHDVSDNVTLETASGSKVLPRAEAKELIRDYDLRVLGRQSIDDFLVKNFRIVPRAKGGMEQIPVDGGAATPIVPALAVASVEPVFTATSQASTTEATSTTTVIEALAPPRPAFSPNENSVEWNAAAILQASERPMIMSSMNYNEIAQQMWDLSGGNSVNTSTRSANPSLIQPMSHCDDAVEIVQVLRTTQVAAPKLFWSLGMRAAAMAMEAVTPHDMSTGQSTLRPSNSSYSNPMMAAVLQAADMQSKTESGTSCMYQCINAMYVDSCTTPMMFPKVGTRRAWVPAVGDTGVVRSVSATPAALISASKFVDLALQQKTVPAALAAYAMSTWDVSTAIVFVPPGASSVDVANLVYMQVGATRIRFKLRSTYVNLAAAGPGAANASYFVPCVRPAFGEAIQRILFVDCGSAWSNIARQVSVALPGGDVLLSDYTIGLNADIFALAVVNDPVPMPNCILTWQKYYGSYLDWIRTKHLFRSFMDIDLPRQYTNEVGDGISQYTAGDGNSNINWPWGGHKFQVVGYQGSVFTRSLVVPNLVGCFTPGHFLTRFVLCAGYASYVEMAPRLSSVRALSSILLGSVGYHILYSTIAASCGLNMKERFGYITAADMFAYQDRFTQVETMWDNFSQNVCRGKGITQSSFFAGLVTNIPSQVVTFSVSYTDLHWFGMKLDPKLLTQYPGSNAYLDTQYFRCVEYGTTGKRISEIVSAGRFMSGLNLSCRELFNGPATHTYVAYEDDGDSAFLNHYANEMQRPVRPHVMSISYPLLPPGHGYMGNTSLFIPISVVNDRASCDWFSVGQSLGGVEFSDTRAPVPKADASLFNLVF